MSVYMELLPELLITVGLSILVSCLIAKLFSMLPSPPPCAAVSVTGSIEGEAAVSREQKRDDGESAVRDTESERVVRSVDEEAVRLDEHGEEEESRAETIGSPLARDDDDGGEVVEENDEKSDGVSVAVGGGGLEEREIRVGGVEFEERLFDESYEREDKLREIGIESVKFREIEIESGKDGVNVSKSEEVRVLEREDSMGHESDGVESNANESEGEGILDDWEGVERTELEKRFGDAVVFVDSKNNADIISSLDSDTKMELHGLHKVAIEGPCSVPSPMALKVSARAKWNAWQQLGDMSREVAMEQYIALLSKSIPGWIGDDAKDGKQVFSDMGSATILPFNLQDQRGKEDESTLEEPKRRDEECGMIGSSETP